MPGAKIQSRQLFSERCFLIRRFVAVSFPLCVKNRYFLRPVPMEARNSLLKCFQAKDSDKPVDILKELAKHSEIWGSTISDVQQEGTSSSSHALAGRATAGPGGV